MRPRMVSRPETASHACRPRAQQPVGEHMPAFGIGAELDFVDGHEIGAHALGHRLDRVIDLARQQTQRQTDHTGAMAQHPLNRVMGFTCVCRAKYGHSG